MTTPLRHDVYPCSFGDLTVNDVRSVQVTPGVTHMMMVPGGNVIADGIAMAFAEPVVNITTGDVATVIAATGMATGLSVSAGAWEVQWEKRAPGGAYAGSTSHVTLNGANGFLYATSLTAEQDSADGAELACSFMALSSDGYTAPITVNTSQSLVGTPDVPLRHSLGPVYVNGTLIAGVTSIRIDSGLTIEAKRSDGGVFPVACMVTKREPMVELSVLNPALIDEAALGPFISALSSTGIVAYLQAVAPGGGRAAGNSGTHISVSSNTGVWQVTNQQGTAGQDVVTTVQAKLTTNFTIATNASLP